MTLITFLTCVKICVFHSYQKVLNINKHVAPFLYGVTCLFIVHILSESEVIFTTIAIGCVISVLLSFKIGP